MTISRISPILLATAFALAGCGGGGGVLGAASTPPPPPPPPPAVQSGAIFATTTSQQFAVAGAARPFTGDQTSLLAGTEQLQVRYVSATNSYEVQLPHSQSWAGISAVSSQTGLTAYGGDTAGLWVREPGYQYSRLLEWADKGSTMGGFEAIGIATPPSGIPASGSATYEGPILGHTSEYQSGLADDFAVDGSIRLLFDFGLGSLSGSISPNLHQGYTLGSLNFADTVYSTGSATFSGRFDTNIPGVNSFSGLFTGPNAQELIGNFAFPYKSPIDGNTYQADGAFIGAK